MPEYQVARVASYRLGTSSRDNLYFLTQLVAGKREVRFLITLYNHKLHHQLYLLSDGEDYAIVVPHSNYDRNGSWWARANNGPGLGPFVTQEMRNEAEKGLRGYFAKVAF
jgi:hypothetical protein